MPREHSAITLTADEIVAFISGQRYCIVATLEADGSPWGDAAACRLHDGKLLFRVTESSRSRRNLEADPRVCCTLESKGADYYSAVAAMVHGHASPVSSDVATASGLDTLADPVTGSSNKDVVFAVDLDHVVSFDFAKIKRRFDQ